jgi:hypothetical protein
MSWIKKVYYENSRGVYLMLSEDGRDVPPPMPGVMELPKFWLRGHGYFAWLATYAAFNDLALKGHAERRDWGVRYMAAEAAEMAVGKELEEWAGSDGGGVIEKMREEASAV